MKLHWKTVHYAHCILSHNVGSLGEYPVCHWKGSFCCLKNSVICTGRMLDQFQQSIWHTTSYLGPDMPFGDCWYVSPFMGSNPAKYQFGVTNRHFTAKIKKYQKFTLSKLLHRSQTNLYTNKDHQNTQCEWSRDAFNKLKMVDSGHLENENSQYLCNGLTDVNERIIMMHLDHQTPLEVKISRF